jgi:anti-sigma factor RsiW
MTHDELQDLLGAYALDAVDTDEAQAVEDHLRSCPRCRAEVEAHRETAGWLAHGGAPAPDGVWDSIAGRLEDAPAPVELARILSWETPEHRAAVSPRRRRAVEWVAGIAAALVLVLGGVAVNQQRQIDRLDSRAGIEQALASAVSNPRARQVSLDSPTGGDARVRAVVLPDGTGYLVAKDGLPALDDDRTYQLWGINDAKVVSLGVLGSRPTIVPFHTSGDVRTLAITEEERGGVVASKNQPIVAGQVNA